MPRALPVLRIAHLYPTLMNLYGDRGNVLALVHRARLRGLRVEVDALEPGDRIRARRHHVYFFGGGQDVEQSLIHRDLVEKKGRALADELADGAACLAVCGGYQLLGRYYEAFDGERMDGIGALDLHTTAGATRAIGNVLVAAELSGTAVELVGFENHGGRTWLGPGLTPLGRVLVGAGNNGEDGGEGVIAGATVGTYLHGPVLPKNPALTDFLLARGLARLARGYELAPAPDAAERAAFESAKRLTLAERGTRRDLFKRT